MTAGAAAITADPEQFGRWARGYPASARHLIEYVSARQSVQASGKLLATLTLIAPPPRHRSSCAGPRPTTARRHGGPDTPTLAVSADRSCQRIRPRR